MGQTGSDHGVPGLPLFTHLFSVCTRTGVVLKPANSDNLAVTAVPLAIDGFVLIALIVIVMPIAVDSINGVANESRRAGMSRPVDPET